MGVTGNKFSALLVDLRGPSTRPEGPNRLLPNHVANIGAVTKSFQGLGAAWDYAGGTNYQSSYCGEGWDSWNRPIKPKPKVDLARHLHDRPSHSIYHDGVLQEILRDLSHVATKMDHNDISLGHHTP